MVDWDSTFFILIVWGATLSPALIILIWVWLTPISLVRKKLLQSFFAVAAIPLLSAGLYALFTALCSRGHIDQPFGDCVIIPDILANILPMVPLILFVPAAFTIFFCAYLEFDRFSREE